MPAAAQEPAADAEGAADQNGNTAHTQTFPRMHLAAHASLLAAGHPAEAALRLDAATRLALLHTQVPAAPDGCIL